MMAKRLLSNRIIYIVYLFTAVISAQYDDSCRQSGDIQVLGIFPNTLNYNSTSNYCYEYSMENIQLTQAMIYAIDVLINANPRILPGIKVGWTILDSCSSSEKALASVSYNLMIHGELNGVAPICNPKNYPNHGSGYDKFNSNDNDSTPILGIIGERSKQVSTSLAVYSSSLKILQISYSPHHVSTMDHSFIPYYYHSISSIESQVLAASDIIASFDWNWISIIIAGSDDAKSYTKSFHKSLKDRNVCIAYIGIIDDNSIESDLTAITLQLKELTRSILLFSLPNLIEPFLNKVQHYGLSGKTWIGSFRWLKSTKITTRYSNILDGTIAIDFKRKPLDDFTSYINQLDLCNNVKNPWFMAVWSNRLRLNGYNVRTVIENCKLNHTIKSQLARSFYNIRYHSAFVMDAALALANALHDLLGCNSTYCPPKSTHQLNRPQLQKYLNKVNFKGISNTNFNFGSTKGNNLTFRILNLQKQDGTGSYLKDLVIGEWSEKTGLILNKTKIVWKGNKYPSSRCSDDCLPGTFLHYQHNEFHHQSKCCWSCSECKAYHTITNTTNQVNCTECDPFSAPNQNKSKCIPYEMVSFNFNGQFSLILYCVWSIFLIGLIFVWIVIIWKRQTPIVKGSNFILSNILLVFTTLCISASVLILLPVNSLRCTLNLFLMANCSLGSTVTIICKTGQVAVIFRNSLSQTVLGKKLSETRYHVMIIIAIMTMINGILCGLLVYQPIDIMKIDNDNHQLILQCGLNRYAAFKGIIIIWGILSLTALLFAFRIRSLPDNFNDARYIFLATVMYTTLSATAIPAMYATEGIMAQEIMCLSMTCYGFISLICYFLPKIYIIFYRPTLNTRHQVFASLAKFTFASIEYPSTSTSAKKSVEITTSTSC